tara:strand:- start:116 stop:268 length:153 start_codon:yes stop_codon:yes gene_type:complete
MLTFESIKKKLSKKRLGKYLLFGGFAFFFVKGLVWLVIFFVASYSLVNNF